MPAHDLNLALIDATTGSLSDRCTGSRYATPIANCPLIGHVLGELAENGIDESRIIAAPDVANELSRLLGSGERWGVRVSYVEAPKSDRRQAVLRELDRALAQGPVVLHPGDRLLRGQLTTMRARFVVGDVDSVLPEQATVGASAEGTEPPLSADVVMLGSAMRPVLEQLAVTADPDAGMVDALLHSDCRLAVCEQRDHWCYSDCTAALLAANRMLLDALPEQLAPGGLGEGNEIHGRVAIESGAWVANCVLHGPI
ncbi:MAG: sugar phosphate nucleotidyltransferase, partial [Solirubrobacteraceae bacterium]